MAMIYKLIGYITDKFQISKSSATNILLQSEEFL